MHRTILVLVALVLVACSTPEDPGVAKGETVTARVELHGTQTAVWVTRDAAPTRTPGPTFTPDSRSDFEKCRDSGSGVRYVISGTNVDAVSLTWENDTGGTNQGDYLIPFCVPYRGFESGGFVYISAQIETGSGNIICVIYEESKKIAEARASGFASIATCSGSTD